MDTSITRLKDGVVMTSEEHIDWLKSNYEFLKELEKQMEEMEDTHTIVPNEILKELKRKEAVYDRELQLQKKLFLDT
jgi:glutamine synthetase adenylyltransferase